MLKTQANANFQDIISTENLFSAWDDFTRGKRGKPDVELFAHSLIENTLQLNHDLANKTYRHGGHAKINISDPKPRNISKAPVRDRLLHHAVHRKLYPIFDGTFYRRRLLMPGQQGDPQVLRQALIHVLRDQQEQP